jgi:acetylserotonin O-methyltransferase
MHNENTGGYLVDQDETKGDASIVLELLEAFKYSQTMFSAVSLGVFDALKPGPLSLARLAEILKANPDALERLLDACVGLQLLSRRDGYYHNTRAAMTYLCTDSPNRLVNYISYSNKVLWKLWANLDQAILEGTHRWNQTFGRDGSIFSSFYKTSEDIREFVKSLHGYGLVSSPDVAAAFDLSQFGRLVDLGGGTGHLAIAICQRYPGMKGLVYELPVVVPFANEMITDSDAADRIIVETGDFFDDELPLPEGDLFVLGRIVHDWSESKVETLLGRILKRLPSGGAVLIAEKLIDEDRAGPKWAQMQNLGMLLYTEGKERTLSEYQELLSKVGFIDVRGVITPTPLDAILAFKS